MVIQDLNDGLIMIKEILIEGHQDKEALKDIVKGFEEIRSKSKEIESNFEVKHRHRSERKS